jgi:hypothetical protein
VFNRSKSLDARSRAGNRPLLLAQSPDWHSIPVCVGIRSSRVVRTFCYLDDLMDDPREQPQPRRITRVQQFAVILLGLMMIVTGVATIVESPLFNPYFPAGVLFAPFALAGGTLVIALAIRAGRRR